MIKVWSQYNKLKLYGSGKTILITKTSRKYNKVGRPWKLGQGGMSHAWLLSTFHDQQYGETRSNGNGETDLITKTVHCLHTDEGHISETINVRYENEA